MSERFFLPTCGPEQCSRYMQAIEKASPVETHLLTVHDWAGEIIDMHLAAQPDGEMLSRFLAACRNDMFAEIRRAEIVLFRDGKGPTDDIGKRIRFCVNVGLCFLRDAIVRYLERYEFAAR